VIKTKTKASAVQARRKASGKVGIAKAVRRWAKRKGESLAGWPKNVRVRERRAGGGA
jgi:hypothetical protein